MRYIISAFENKAQIVIRDRKNEKERNNGNIRLNGGLTAKIPCTGNLYAVHYSQRTDPYHMPAFKDPEKGSIDQLCVQNPEFC